MITAKRGIQDGFGWYQQQATKTAMYGESIDAIEPEVEAPALRMLLRLSYTGLGLGEVGEIQGKLKKIIRDSKGVITDEVRAAVRKEIGDELWYLAQLCNELGVDLGEAAVENLEKLASRKERGVLQGSGDNR